MDPTPNPLDPPPTAAGTAGPPTAAPPRAAGPPAAAPPVPAAAPPAGAPAQAPAPAAGAAGRPPLRIERGTCHVLFAFDVGRAIDLDRAERALLPPTQRETIRHKRTTPPYFQLQPAPIRVSQACGPLAVAGLTSEPTVDAVIYDFGAVSIAYRFPLSGTLERLLAFAAELDRNPLLLEHSRTVVRQLLDSLRPAVTRPHIADFVEDYAIYELQADPAAGPPDGLVSAYAADLARLLRCEPAALSDQEIGDALACRISYAPEDVVVLDWNAALLFDRDADDVRTVLEYANVELLEMRYLDDRLDEALDRAYQAVARRRWRWPLGLGVPRADLRRIAALQLDNALLFEGVNNVLKLLGDQYLARIYRLAAQRLHLADWDASILRKLQTLESLYEKVSDLAASRRMELLEWIIILLIALSILLQLAH